MARSPDPTVRTALIEAAAEQLADGGLDALSIRGVATAVGASTMAVYTHFGSKEDLVAEVVREAFTRLRAELAAVAHRPTTPSPTDLAATGAAYRRFALANADLYHVMFAVNPLALTNPAEVQGQPDVGLAAFEELVAAVARCVDAGVLPGDPGRLALQIWATAHGAVSLELAGLLGATHDAQATFDAAVAATFLGLAR